MLAKTRVSRSLDTNRFGEVASYPGADPRVWVSRAIVNAVSVSKGEGVFVDVTLTPIGNEETVIFGVPHAGNGFGQYDPVAVNDTVVIFFPSGDPNEGGILVARIWDEADPPPQLAVDNPKDSLRQIEKDRNYRVVTSGSGSLSMTVENGQVELGGESGLKKVARDGDRESASSLMAAWMGQVETAINLLAGGSVSPLSTTFATVNTPPGASGIAVIAEGSSKVGAVD